MGRASVNLREEPVLGSFKKGGKVKKTGLYKLHKGEKVVRKGKKKKGRKQSVEAMVNSARSNFA